MNGEKMEEKEIIDKINKLLKFKSENDTLEVKSSSGDFLKYTILSLRLQIQGEE